MSFSNMDAYAQWDEEREERQDLLYRELREHLDAPKRTAYVKVEHTGSDVTQSPNGSHHPTNTSSETEEP